MSSIFQTFGQAFYQFSDVYDPISASVLQDFGQSLSSMPSSPLIDIHRISSPVPLGFSGHIVSPIPQHIGQITSHLPYQGFRIWNPLPENYVEMISLFNFDNSAVNRTANPIPQNRRSNVNKIISNISSLTTIEYKRRFDNIITIFDSEIILNIFTFIIIRRKRRSDNIIIILDNELNFDIFLNSKIIKRKRKLFYNVTNRSF